MNATGMKCLLSFILVLICFCSARAQDGLFTLAKAPLTITRDVQTHDFSFTNTGNKTLSRIRITSAHGKDLRSVVIIDTLEPHKTVVYDISKSLARGADYHEATITCLKYSVPIRLDQLPD